MCRSPGFGGMRTLRWHKLGTRSAWVPIWCMISIGHDWGISSSGILGLEFNFLGTRFFKTPDSGGPGTSSGKSRTGGSRDHLVGLRVVFFF